MAIQNKIYVRQSSDFQVDGFWFILDSVLLIGVDIYIPSPVHALMAPFYLNGFQLD